VVVTLVAVLIALPMLYALSIGPVARMLETGWISKSWEPTLESAYLPLIWTANSVPAVESVLTSYLLLWVTPNQAVSAAPPAAVVAPAPTPVPAPSGS